MRTLPKILGNYPTAAGWSLPGLLGSPIHTQEAPWGFELRLQWHAPGGTGRDRTARLDEVAPPYRFHDARWLRPAIDGVLVPPLATWWVLLFGLSILARYHPAEWSAALDLNRSRAAVALDDALEVALEAVPHLVLDAIRQGPLLLRQ